MSLHFQSFAILRSHRQLKSFLMEGNDSSVLHIWYHGCWWPGTARSQGIEQSSSWPSYPKISVSAPEGWTYLFIPELNGHHFWKLHFQIHFLEWNFHKIVDEDLLPGGTKPLPEPMLTYQQLTPVTFISGQSGNNTEPLWYKAQCVMIIHRTRHGNIYNNDCWSIWTSKQQCFVVLKFKLISNHYCGWNQSVTASNLFWGLNSIHISILISSLIYHNSDLHTTVIYIEGKVQKWSLGSWPTLRSSR